MRSSLLSSFHLLRDAVNGSHRDRATFLAAIRDRAGGCGQRRSGVEQAGVAGLAQDVFDIFVADAHRLIRDSVVESYGILGHELHLAGAIERWPETLEFLRNVSGLTLVDLRLQALGEPPRFLYLEEHERGVV